MAEHRNPPLFDVAGEQDCRVMALSLARTLATIGDRWTLQVVAELLEAPKRFGELAEALTGIAPNVLTGRLRQLEREGLVDAVPYSRRPVRFSYQLTDSGRELQHAIALLSAWGSRQYDVEGATHTLCGTPLETRLYCPTCERPADGEGSDAAVEWV